MTRITIGTTTGLLIVNEEDPASVASPSGAVPLRLSPSTAPIPDVSTSVCTRDRRCAVSPTC